jgi:hypothetical protein
MVIAASRAVLRAVEEALDGVARAVPGQVELH